VLDAHAFNKTFTRTWKSARKWTLTQDILSIDRQRFESGCYYC